MILVILKGETGTISKSFTKYPNSISGNMTSRKYRKQLCWALAQIPWKVLY